MAVLYCFLVVFLSCGSGGGDPSNQSTGSNPDQTDSKQTEKKEREKQVTYDVNRALEENGELRVVYPGRGTVTLPADQLELENVRKNGTRAGHEDQYRVCATFKRDMENGSVLYDLDFLMGRKEGDFQINHILLHKLDGKRKLRFQDGTPLNEESNEPVTLDGGESPKEQ